LFIFVSLAHGNYTNLIFGLGIVALANAAGLTNITQQLTMLCDERDLGREWNFSGVEINKLNDYLYAYELLVQCLKVAVVTDRQAVLDGLLLPPQVQT
jgi:hypothetical protein